MLALFCGLFWTSEWMSSGGGVSRCSSTPERRPANAEREGYTSDVRFEKSQKFYEIYLSPPSQESKVDLHGFIFNAQLTEEFKVRYREKFGYIDKDSMNMPTTQFTSFDENRGRSAKIEADTRERRSFGEYMTRRLGEWHVDNYFKSDPTMREVYELKEKMSTMQVEVGQETRFDVHYSLADNSAEMVLKNPYCDSKLRVEMDPGAFGPGRILENRLYLGKQVHRNHYILGHFIEKDGLMRLEWWNNMAFGMQTSFSLSAPFKGEGYTPRESSVGAALQHAF